jgi:hypothetical protein
VAERIAPGYGEDVIAVARSQAREQAPQRARAADLGRGMFLQAALAPRLLPALFRAPGYDPQPIGPGKARYTPFGCFTFTLANL